MNTSAKNYPETHRLIDYDDGQDDAFTVHVKDEPRSMIFIKRGNTMGTVAHECYHAVRRMLEYVGVEKDNEVVAYHLGYLVNQIWRGLRVSRP